MPGTGPRGTGVPGEDGVAPQLPDSRLTYFRFFVRETFPFLDHLKLFILRSLKFPIFLIIYQYIKQHTTSLSSMSGVQAQA